MATNCETSIIDYLKTKNGTSTLSQIIQHVKLTKREINQHLYELKRKGKVLKVHKQNPPVWKLIRHSTHSSKLSSIESSGNTETKCGEGSILSNDRPEEAVVASPIMHKQERNFYTSDGRDRARGRRGGRGRGRGRGGSRPRAGSNQRFGPGIQRREGNWTDGSEIKFTPSPTADKAEEILRFLLNTKNPASVEEITCKMGSYATLDDVNYSLTKLVDEKKVIKMLDGKYAPNVVKSVEMSLLTDDPSVVDFKTEEFGNSKGASSLGFDPQMEVDEVNQDGQFSDEDDYNDDDYDDEDDFGLEMKSSEGWGVSSFYVKTESNSDFESDREVKLGDESLLSEEDMAPDSDPGSVKQEFVENHEGGKEIPSDLLEHETPLDLSEVCGEDKYEDSGESTKIDMSSNPDTKEQTIKDQVLLAFTKMPLQTGIIFVLKTKLNCEISNLEEVLNKLKVEKYVALTHNKVWSLTKSGEAYLASKGLWTKCETPVSMGRGRIFNQKGKGPPQSPLKLITSNTVFSAGVEKPPVAAASYQPAKEQNIQIFPSQSAVVSIPSLMNVDTTNLSSNQSLKTNSKLMSGGFLSTSSNVTSSFNKSITSDSLSASDSRMPHTPPMSDGIGSGFQATAPQKYHMPQGKPLLIPQTPAEIARKENEGLYGRTDLKNPVYLNSSVMPNPPSSSSSNLHIAPSTSGQLNTCSSLISTGSSPSLHQSQLSSPMVLSQPTPKSSDSACSSLLSSKLNDNLTISAESFSAVNKNPISALMEYAQSRHQQAKIEVVSQRGPSHKPTFIIAAMIGQRIFPGVKSGSKKDGRTEAADLALRILLSEGQYNVNSEPSKNINVSSSTNSQMTHFDKIAALSHQAFNQLIASIPEKFAGRKVIAALVLKRSPSDNGTVISVGSGNRCITGEQLSLEGNTVNDSHAEIITRRGFIRFLYKQLETYTINQSHEFFEKGSSGKLRIKPNFTFHLYISTAPCGDGALFSPRDAASNRGPVEDVENHEHNPTFTSNVQGVLRTKMEGGEGTIPIESDFTVQTWDGIVRGERLRTMSCTDKICRWNVVGMQGALLSHLLEPVYLNSLTLGYLYDHGHLSRAVCCRVGKGEPDINSLLPSGFQLNHPWLGRMTACEPQRETQKTKALSINWCLGDERPEVIDGTTGRCYTGVERTFFSRLCKKELYTSFRSVCTKFGLSDLLSAKTYLDAKKMATDFQAAKNVMLKRLKDNGFSVWVSKPMEEEMFSS